MVQSPYFASSVGGIAAGGITMGSGLSYLTIDGGTNGVVQNTANGSSLANHAPSTGVSAFSCGNCTVKSLTIANIYVNVSGNGSLGDNSVVRALDFTGSNWVISNNTVHDCGWCLVEFYNNADTNVQIYGNNIYNFGHAWALAGGASKSTTNVYSHDNQFHDTSNWDAAGCPFHQDGLHAFGTTGSWMSGVYLYNNYFYGNWGSCPTGFVFIEGGSSSTPAHMRSFYMWNNVGIVTSGIVNTNGWFQIASGESGTQDIYNNTILGPNNTDNTLCIGMQGLSGLSFENNTISNCGDPVWIGNSTLKTVDYNFYGTTCGNHGNCFVWNGSFMGSFSQWRSACSCDSHAVQSNSPLLSAIGAPQSGSPAIGAGNNLSTIATGPLAALASDTTLGNTRTPLARPGGGTPWDIGAYDYASAPAPPTNLSATPN
jgi:hypothetical protein